MIEASNQITTTTDILIHVTILFSFLSAFFFMYISRIESDAFKNELGGLIKDKINELVDKNPEIVFELSDQKQYIQRLATHYNTETKESLQRNIMIKFLSVFTVLILLAIILSIILTTYFECDKKINLGSILLQNIIIFIFIGIVEYNFFTRVAAKYTPVVPSLMTTTMLDTFKSEMKAGN